MKTNEKDAEIRALHKSVRPGGCSCEICSPKLKTSASVKTGKSPKGGYYASLTFNGVETIEQAVMLGDVLEVMLKKLSEGKPAEAADVGS